jgi:hypothetical protein
MRDALRRIPKATDNRTYFPVIRSSKNGTAERAPSALCRSKAVSG